MRIGLTIAILLGAATARAADVETIKAFLKKEDACQFGVYEVAKSKKLRAKLPALPSVRCVDDMIVGKGTVNEKIGCAAFLYNIETGERSPLMSEFGLNIASKKCADGGFETLMDQLLYSVEGKKKFLVRSEFEQLQAPSKGYRLVVRSTQDKFATAVGLPKEIDLGKIDESK